MSFAKTISVGAAAAAVVFSLSFTTASAVGLNLATGLDASGNLQTTGGSSMSPQVDANWELTAGGINPLDTNPYPKNAYVVGSSDADWYGGWVPNGSNSSWIAANPFDANGNGLETFTRTFYVSTPSTASIVNGSWTLDDSGVLLLNGNTLSSLGGGNWGSLSSFSTMSGDFVHGLNTLTLQITGTDNYLEGVRLEGQLVGAGVPELSTWAMMALGFAGLGLVGRRASKKSAAIAT